MGASNVVWIGGGPSPVQTCHGVAQYLRAIADDIENGHLTDVDRCVVGLIGRSRSCVGEFGFMSSAEPIGLLEVAKYRILRKYEG